MNAVLFVGQAGIVGAFTAYSILVYMYLILSYLIRLKQRHMSFYHKNIDHNSTPKLRIESPPVIL